LPIKRLVVVGGQRVVQHVRVHVVPVAAEAAPTRAGNIWLPQSIGFDPATVGDGIGRRGGGIDASGIGRVLPR